MIELGRYVTKKTMKSIAIIFDNFFSFPIVAISNLRWFSKVFDTDRTYERLEKVQIILHQNFIFLTAWWAKVLTGSNLNLVHHMSTTNLFSRGLHFFKINSYFGIFLQLSSQSKTFASWKSSPKVPIL